MVACSDELNTVGVGRRLHIYTGIGVGRRLHIYTGTPGQRFAKIYFKFYITIIATLFYKKLKIKIVVCLLHESAPGHSHRTCFSAT